MHGHLATLRALLHRLDLGPEDRVVLLGDLIDRGPDAAGVVDLVRRDPRLLALIGNHERMATQSLTSQGHIELWPPWMARGGAATWGSYIVRSEGELHVAKDAFLDDLLWMDQLPTEIVLNEVRMVHAGYDPRKALADQTERELLWIRRRFYNHDEALDSRRTVVFGHSTTTKFGPAPGQVVHSDLRLENGRPAWVALDVGAYNHADPCLAAFDLASGRSVRQRTLPSERWFEAPGAKEAPVADFFGLKVLERRRASHARPRAAVYASLAGLVLPHDGACRRWAEAQAAIAANEPAQHGWRFIRARANQTSGRPQRDARPLSSRQAQHQHRILLGPGTPPARQHPSLPAPESYRIVRAQTKELAPESIAVARTKASKTLMQA